MKIIKDCPFCEINALLEKYQTELKLQYELGSDEGFDDQERIDELEHLVDRLVYIYKTFEEVHPHSTLGE